MISHLLPRDIILIKIFNIMAVPIMDSACTVWASFRSGNLHIIHRLENAASRAITKKYDYINVRGNTLFDDIMLSRFTDRFQYYVSILMFKAVIKSHTIISNDIHLSHEVNERDLRSCANTMLYKLYKTRLTYEITQNALTYYKGPFTWNA